MTYALPPGEELDGENVLSTSSWDFDDGPDSLDDIFTQLGTRDPNTLAALTKSPQWDDFSQRVRDDVSAWLADNPPG